MSSDESTIWTGGKDCAVIRWDVETGKKDVFPGGRNRFDCGGHFEKVLSVRLVEQRGLVVYHCACLVVRGGLVVVSRSLKWTKPWKLLR